MNPIMAPVEVEYNNLIGLLIAGLLFLIGYLILAKPKGLRKSWRDIIPVLDTNGEETGTQSKEVVSLLNVDELEKVVKETLGNHCPKVHDQIIDESCNKMKNELAKQLSPLREDLSKWRGSVDEKLKNVDRRFENGHGKDESLSQDIRELRKEISNLNRTILDTKVK